MSYELCAANDCDRETLVEPELNGHGRQPFCIHGPMGFCADVCSGTGGGTEERRRSPPAAARAEPPVVAVAPRGPPLLRPERALGVGPGVEEGGPSLVDCVVAVWWLYGGTKG